MKRTFTLFAVAALIASGCTSEETVGVRTNALEDSLWENQNGLRQPMRQLLKAKSANLLRVRQKKSVGGRLMVPAGS